MSFTVKRKRGRPRRDEPREINDFDMALIQEFKRRPAFYDRRNPQYRNREYIEQLWSEISDALGYNVSLLKDRMLQLRNRYNLEKRRMDTMQEQYNDSNISSQWFLFSHLTFLGDHIKTRRSFSQKQVETQPGSNSSDDDDDCDSQQFANGNATESEHLQGSSSIANGIKPASNVIHYANPHINTQKPLEAATIDGADKFKAFGQFLTSSLIEMNEKDALLLIQKFTSDLVNSLLAEQRSK